MPVCSTWGVCRTEFETGIVTSAWLFEGGGLAEGWGRNNRIVSAPYGHRWCVGVAWQLPCSSTCPTRYLGLANWHASLPSGFKVETLIDLIQAKIGNRDLRLSHFTESLHHARGELKQEGWQEENLNWVFVGVGIKTSITPLGLHVFSSNSIINFDSDFGWNYHFSYLNNAHDVVIISLHLIVVKTPPPGLLRLFVVFC